MSQIQNVLGEIREVRYPPDAEGIWECPFCASASKGGFPQCQNPACEASQWATVEFVLSTRARKATADAEAERRTRDASWAAEFHREQREERQAYSLVEADRLRAAGQCIACADIDGFRQVSRAVRHRRGTTCAANGRTHY